MELKSKHFSIKILTEFKNAAEHLGNNCLMAEKALTETPNGGVLSSALGVIVSQGAECPVGLCPVGRWVSTSPSPFSPSKLHVGSRALVQRLPGQLGVFALK